MLNYPLYEKIDNNTLPKLPNQISADQLNGIVQQSRGDLIDQVFYALHLISSRRSIVEKMEKGIRYLLGKPI